MGEQSQGYPRAPFGQPEYGPTAASPAGTRPTIVGLIDSIYGQTEVLASAFVELLAAIQPVLRPSNPVPTPGRGEGGILKASADRSDVLDRLYAVQGKLEHLLREIHEAANRADLR